MVAVASDTILAEADGKCRRWHSLGEIHDHLPFASQVQAGAWAKEVLTLLQKF